MGKRRNDHYLIVPLFFCPLPLLPRAPKVFAYENVSPLPPLLLLYKHYRVKDKQVDINVKQRDDTNIMKIKNIVLSIVTLSFSLLLVGCWSMPFHKAMYKEVSSSTNLFSYDEKNVPDIGAVYHYKKSNLDGSYASDEWNYMESYQHTESFKIYPFSKIQNKTDLVIADYNIQGFYVTALNAYLVSKNGDRKLNVTITSNDGLSYRIQFGKNDYALQVGHTPSYNYNFDWCDFFFMYRHLIDKESTFDIGVTVPDSQMKLIYAGKAYIKYIDNRTYHGFDCRYYEISGDAFSSQTGALYMDRADGKLIEISMPVRNNGMFNSFKYSFVDKTEMIKEEWNALILQKTKDHLGK